MDVDTKLRVEDVRNKVRIEATQSALIDVDTCNLPSCLARLVSEYDDTLFEGEGVDSDPNHKIMVYLAFSPNLLRELLYIFDTFVHDGNISHKYASVFFNLSSQGICMSCPIDQGRHYQFPLATSAFQSFYFKQTKKMASSALAIPVIALKDWVRQLDVLSSVFESLPEHTRTIDKCEWIIRNDNPFTITCRLSSPSVRKSFTPILIGRMLYQSFSCELEDIGLPHLKDLPVSAVHLVGSSKTAGDTIKLSSRNKYWWEVAMVEQKSNSRASVKDKVEVRALEELSGKESETFRVGTRLYEALLHLGRACDFCSWYKKPLPTFFFKTHVIQSVGLSILKFKTRDLQLDGYLILYSG